MSFIEKLKKLFLGEEKEPEEPAPLEISLEKVPSILNNKKDEISNKKEKIKSDLDEELENFKENLNQIIPSLEKVDISERKEQEKIKIIVRENLDLFILNLKRTLQSLENIDEKDLKKYIQKITSILHEFNRSSSKPYEKATILVGEDLKKARSVLTNFMREVDNKINSNKDVFEAEKSISEISSILSELEQRSSHLNEINLKIAELIKKLENQKKEYESTQSEISDLMKSREFSEDMKMKEYYEKSLNSLNKEIQSTREAINLKYLSKKFHAEKKKSNLVREYIKDFKSAMIKDESLEILKIINEANLKNTPDLQYLRDKIMNLKPPILETEYRLSDLRNESNSLKSEMEKTQSDISNEEKKKDKIQSKIAELKPEAIEKTKNLLNN